MSYKLSLCLKIMSLLLQNSFISVMCPSNHPNIYFSTNDFNLKYDWSPVNGYLIEYLSFRTEYDSTMSYIILVL